MGGYFSVLGYNKEQKEICYDRLDGLNSVNNREIVLDKIQSVHKAERSLNQNSERLDEFKIELARKHEKRREILAEKRMEMEKLRDEIASLKSENEILKKKFENKTDYLEIQRIRKENEELRKTIADITHETEKYKTLTEKNNELRINIAEMQEELQNLNKEVLDFEKEREDYNAHVIALKDVIAVSKNMLQIREAQLKELKVKVENIETSLAGREINILSQDLRKEYERQLQNIRNLKVLYEERQRADRLEKQELASKLEDSKKDLEKEQQKRLELDERISELENNNSEKYDEIKTLESNLGFSKAECRQYQAELSVINQLFSEILLGFNHSQDIDLDRLTKLLEENHGLLQNIVVNEISNEVSSALPKVLLDLVNQVNEKEIIKNKEEHNCDNDDTSQKLDCITEELESQNSTIHELNSVEEIVENLPKVWRILIELLSHQKAPVCNSISIEANDSNNPCYKVVETSKGPSVVLSVSQTFIRLKDLILEKKSLEKETNNLKQLNTHLENRLQDQEKRLETVTNELSKTWHVVGKLQKQHQLLHTQEKILRYELAQKRKLLTELKEELEYSREKWLQAREKNSSTEQQWKKLRTEFALRRNTVNDDINNSCESGYSDDRECSSDDEPGYETDVSECNQKVLEDKEVSTSETTDKENVEDNHSEICNGTNNELLSINDQLKTDLVQHSNEENTVSREIYNNITTENSTNLLCINENESNSESQENSSNTLSKSFEEFLAAKDKRLKRLENEAHALVTKVTNTNTKSTDINNKLDNLHELYGESSNTQENSDHDVHVSLDVEKNTSSTLEDNNQE